MAGYYTESNYENAVLQLLNEGLGYTYVYGPDVERDYHSPLYEDVLLPALQRINKGLPLDAINEAVYKLKNFETVHCCKRTDLYRLSAKRYLGQILCQRRGTLHPRLPR